MQFQKKRYTQWGKGDEIATPEPVLSTMRFFASLRITTSEGARSDENVVRPSNAIARSASDEARILMLGVLYN
jgi:hypothetical protein